MDQVGSRREILPQFSVFLDKAKDLLTGSVSVLADKTVNFRVFAESFDTGRQNHKLASIRNGHASPIDGLVAKPCAVELFGIEIDDHFFGAFAEQREIDLTRKFCSALKTLLVIAHVEPIDDKLPLRVDCDDLQLCGVAVTVVEQRAVVDAREVSLLTAAT